MPGRCWLAMLLAASFDAAGAPENGQGRAVFERICSTCHPADVVSSMGNSREGWRDLVNEMFLRGGSATSREKTQIVEYLARKYPLPAGRKSNK